MPVKVFKFITLLIVVLISINSNAAAQLALQRRTDRAYPRDINTEYFILGTIKDYMGRYADKYTLDSYAYYEKPLVKILYSMIKYNYPNMDFYLNATTDKRGLISYKITSIALDEKINSYYHFENGTSSTGGIIANDIFENDNEKLAFLAGAYTRFGMPDDTAYCIHVANSLSKTQVCFKLLKDFGCKPTYKMLSNNIPVGHFVYFHPTKKVRAYLSRYASLREQINRNNILESKRMELEARRRRAAKLGIKL